MKRSKLLSTNPVGEGRIPPGDLLNYEPIAEALAETVRSTEEALTIGVFGKWGTGKTSLLRLVKKALSSDPLTLQVWFNAWLFELEDNPLFPLVEQIISELKKSSARSFRKSLRGKGIRLRRIFESLAASLSIDIGTSELLPVKLGGKLNGGAFVEHLKALGRDARPPRSAYVKALDELDQLVLPADHRVVVYIDDLDRCLPGNALRLLQSIKLAMARPGFVFLLALSPDVIERLLKKKYDEEYGISDFSGKEYLEKIIDLPFHLPDLSNQIARFSKGLSQKLSPDERESLGPILELVERACENIPRAAIRFINIINVTRAVYENTREEGDAPAPLVAFAIARLLQLKWNPIYRELIGAPGLCDDIAIWSQADLDSDASAIPSAQRRILTEAKSDPILAELLLGEPCKEWLRNPWQREATTQFQLFPEEVAPETPSKTTQMLPEGIAREPNAGLRKRIVGERAVTALASYLWRNGWKEYTESSEVEFGWPSFVSLIAARYYRFESWSRGEIPWEDTEQLFAAYFREIIEQRSENDTFLDGTSIPRRPTSSSTAGR